MGVKLYIPHAPAGMLSLVVNAAVFDAEPNLTKASTAPMLMIFTAGPWQLSATFELTELTLMVDDAAQGVNGVLTFCAYALVMNRDKSQNTSHPCVNQPIDHGCGLHVGAHATTSGGS